MIELERETGGRAQFDWMLDGGSFKSQPIEFWLFCFNKKPTDVSPHKYISCCFILRPEKCSNKKNQLDTNDFETILKTASF